MIEESFHIKKQDFTCILKKQVWLQQVEVMDVDYSK